MVIHLNARKCIPFQPIKRVSVYIIGGGHELFTTEVDIYYEADSPPKLVRLRV